jgi:hypothetical protein
MAALTVVAVACSSGHARVSAGPGSTNPGGAAATSTSVDASTSSSTKQLAKKAAKKKKATKKAGSVPTTTVATAKGSLAGPGVTSTNSFVTITTAPFSGGTSPTTARVTTTTVPGPRPYDPTKPIDLGGTPGVTPAEQHRAEQLVRDTLRDLPRYADYTAAYADGYRSIGDSVTGYDHFVKWSYVNDGHILDSRLPESLVYRVVGSGRKLVSAMYMMPLGSRFTDVPDVGGALTQWHVHGTLCLVDNPGDPLQKLIGGFAKGDCPAGSTKAGSSPMLHVWIVANPCGPFAALEGFEAGEPPPGEPRLCDTAHGSG